MAATLAVSLRHTSKMELRFQLPSDATLSKKEELQKDGLQTMFSQALITLQFGELILNTTSVKVKLVPTMESSISTINTFLFAECKSTAMSQRTQHHHKKCKLRLPLLKQTTPSYKTISPASRINSPPRPNARTEPALATLSLSTLNNNESMN